jgi:GTP-sensing pleiotropic transcriptional regulator CodY
MAAELVDRLAISGAVRRFHSMGVAGCRSLRLTILYFCNMSFVELLLFLFGVFWGMCDVISCNVCLLNRANKFIVEGN